MLSSSVTRAGSRRNGGWLGSRVVGLAAEQGSASPSNRYEVRGLGKVPGRDL